jgi:hypothetical protein
MKDNSNTTGKNNSFRKSEKLYEFQHLKSILVYYKEGLGKTQWD